MSMDSLDQLEIQMRMFAEGLEHFNNNITAHVRELESELERLDQLWPKDEAHRQFKPKETSALDAIKSYMDHDGPKYTAFIIDKLMWLIKFLHP